MSDFSCGHHNYGTAEDPSSVFHNCATCGDLYCDQCNYVQHICHGCGDDYRHGDYKTNHGEGKCA